MDGFNRERGKTYGKVVGSEWWPDDLRKVPVKWKTKDGLKGVDAKDSKSSPRADHFKHGPTK